jgi:hypothetical protein
MGASTVFQRCANLHIAAAFATHTGDQLVAMTALA